MRKKACLRILLAGDLAFDWKAVLLMATSGIGRVLNGVKDSISTALVTATVVRRCWRGRRQVHAHHPTHPRRSDPSPRPDTSSKVPEVLHLPPAVSALVPPSNTDPERLLGYCRDQQPGFSRARRPPRLWARSVPVLPFPDSAAAGRSFPGAVRTRPGRRRDAGCPHGWRRNDGPAGLRAGARSHPPVGGSLELVDRRRNTRVYRAYSRPSLCMPPGRSVWRRSATRTAGVDRQ